MTIPTTIGNLAMSVSEDKAFLDTIYQADGVTAQDLTGWHLTFSVFSYGRPDLVYFSKTVAGGGIVIQTQAGTTLGQCQINVNAADTASMNADQYEWSVRRTDGGANTVVSKGLFTLLSASSSGATG